jgi:hypothetical protein
MFRLRYQVIEVKKVIPCGYCIVVVPLPSKQEVRVRFPLSAPSFNGGCSQVVKAVDCDSTIRGFNSRHSPNFFCCAVSIPYCFLFVLLARHFVACPSFAYKMRLEKRLMTSTCGRQSIELVNES